jgi:dolichol kinase
VPSGALVNPSPPPKGPSAMEAPAMSTPPPPDPLGPLVDRTEGLQPWRRIFHALTGCAVAGWLSVSGSAWETHVALFGAGVVLLFLGDLLRLRIPALNRLFFRLFRPLASPREAGGIASSTWYLLGCWLAIVIFPVDIALRSILVLALADPIASYVGRRWGKHAFFSGSVEGSILFFSVSLAILAPFAGGPVGALVAGAATLLERIPWRLDDNLTIPLGTGALLWSLL